MKATEKPGSGLHTVRVPDKLVLLFEGAQRYVSRYFAEQRSAPERGTLEVSGQRLLEKPYDVERLQRAVEQALARVVKP